MLLIRLALTYLTRRKLRTFLTISSVAVAVAAVVAFQGINWSMDFVTNEIAGLLGGRAQLEVKAPLAGMDEDYLVKVQDTPGVKDAVPMVQTMAQIKEFPDFVTVLGIDPDEDQSVRTYQLAEGRLLQKGERGLAVPKELLRGSTLTLGDTVHLQEMSGMQEYKIVGVLEDTGVARANGGITAFMPLDTAQEAFGMEGKISYVSVMLDKGASAAEVQKELESTVAGTDIQIREPSARAADLDKLLSTTKSFYSLTGSLSLFLALFVVFNTMGIAVTEQKEQIGILRALGWRRREIKGLILVEAGIIGALGSLLGLVIGKYLADGLLALLTPSLKEWAKINVLEVHLEPKDYLFVWLLGLFACLISAWLPARKAARVSPVEAIRKEYPSTEIGYPRWRLLVGLLLIGLAVLIVGASNNAVLVMQVGPFLGMAGAAILLPPLLVGILRRMEGFAYRVFGLAGHLGVSSARRSPRRTVVTGMPLLLGLAISLGFIGMGDSMSGTVSNWVDELVVPDIIVSQGMQVSGSTAAALPEGLSERIRKVDGVQNVAGIKGSRVKWQGKDIDITAIDVAEWESFANPPLVEPGREEALAGLRERGKIWVSESLSLKEGLKVGQNMTLPTPSGERNFQIAAIHKDFSSMEGAIYLNREDFKEYWGDGTIDTFDITAKPGVDPSALRERLEKDLKGDYRVRVELAATFRESTMKIFNSLIDILNLVVIVALLVGATGVANSLLISVLERTRETGILRSLGMLRREVRRIYLLEVGTLLVVSTLLALPVAFGLYAMGIGLQRNFQGWVIDHYFQWGKWAAVIASMAVLAWVSSLYPAWRGSKVDPIEALRSE